MTVWQLVIAIVSIVPPLAGVVWSVIVYFKSRRRVLLAYEIETNADLVSIRRDQGENIEVKLDGQAVQNVRIYGMKFKNAGTAPIVFGSKKSFDQPFAVKFSRRDVIIRAGIAGISPGIITDHDKTKDHILLDEDKQRVTFTDITLNAGEWIKLKILTHGKDQYTVQGHLIGAIGGNGIKESAPSQYRVPGWVPIAISFIMGISMTLLATGPLATFANGNCTWGSLSVTGSSAFADEATGYAQQYQKNCSLASISVHSSSSLLGLDELENGTSQIANADFPAPLPKYSHLQDHPVAVIVFVLIVNKSVNITNLTHSQLLDIFSGKITNWQDITGQSLPITIVNRTSDSGTYRVLKKYVLSDADPLKAPKSLPVPRSDRVVPTVFDTPGALGYVEEGIAIQPSNVSKITLLAIDGRSPTPELVASNAYPFWSIEHMYTKGDPGSLAGSFIRYVQNNLQQTNSLIRLAAMSKEALQTRGYTG